MKKILLFIFVIIFAISCGGGREGSTLTPRPEKFDSFYITLSGGKDFDYTSSAKIEIISKISSSGENVYEFSSKYGDGIKSLNAGYKAYVGDTVIVHAFPSEAHNVVSVDINGEKYNLENGKVSIVVKEAQNILLYGNYLNIKFEVKDEYLEAPVIVNNEYQISTAKQLRWIAARAQRGESFKDKTVKLMNDIDMENIEFTGIASGVLLNSFGGTFDGNGHKVENINIKLHTLNAAFIGNLSETGSVINLTLSGSIVATSSYTAAFVGENRGLIKNVVNNASVKGNTYVGGIVGYNKGYLDGCINNASITGEEYVTGICGLADGISIKNLTNNGSITGYKNVGEIAFSYEGTTTVEGLVKNGSVIENVHVSFD